jgi:hypothetical protein
MTISASPIFRLPGLTAWWSATNPAGDNIIPANGSSVSPWVNLFNNGLLNGTNGTGANQPTYNTNSSNGYPSLVFNGTTQTLAVSNTSALQLSSSLCIIATIKIASLLSAQQTIFSKGTTVGATNYAFQINRTAPGQVSFWNGTAWIDSTSNFSKTGTESVIVSVNWTGSVYSFRGNGNSLGTVSNSTAITTSTQTAVIAAEGSSSLGNKAGVEISDLVICRRFADATSYTDAERFLAFRAGLKSL